MFAEMQIPWGVAELEQHYSPNWYNVYRAANLPRDKYQAADLVWRQHYADIGQSFCPAHVASLGQLARIHALGLVTSGDRDRVYRQLHEFKLWDHFAARVCSDDTRLRKPHPAPLRLALPPCCPCAQRIAFTWATSPEDLQMARSAGVRAAIAILGPSPQKNACAPPNPTSSSIHQRTPRRPSPMP